MNQGDQVILPAPTCACSRQAQAGTERGILSIFGKSGDAGMEQGSEVMKYWNKSGKRSQILLALLLIGMALATEAFGQMDPLPSWNDGPVKQRILKFVEEATKENGPDYVQPAECIAVFDTDGTLWPEKPWPMEFYFVIHRLRQLAPKHPQWRKTSPFKVLFSKNPKALGTLKKQDVEKFTSTAYAGMSQEDFRHEVQKWMAAWRHPKFKVGVTKVYYEPMRELLEYLQGNVFKTFLVTGGSSDFVRTLSEPLYGVPIDQVVGTGIGLRYTVTGGKSFVVRDPKGTSLDSGPLKPVNIERHIGRRPLIAAGNGKSDLEMLTYTADRDGKSLCLVINHDDGSREVEDPIDEALKYAQERGWPIVSIKRDWKSVFPPSRK